MNVYRKALSLSPSLNSDQSEFFSSVKLPSSFRPTTTTTTGGGRYLELETLLL